LWCKVLWNLEVGLLLNWLTISSSARSIWFLVFMKLWKLQQQCVKKSFYVHNPMLIYFILSMVFFCDSIIERWILKRGNVQCLTWLVHNLGGGHVLILVCVLFSNSLCFVQSLFVCVQSFCELALKQKPLVVNTHYNVHFSNFVLFWFLHVI
jgi:hypothetical protein